MISSPSSSASTSTVRPGVVGDVGQRHERRRRPQADQQRHREQPGQVRCLMAQASQPRQPVRGAFGWAQPTRRSPVRPDAARVTGVPRCRCCGRGPGSARDRSAGPGAPWLEGLGQAATATSRSTSPRPSRPSHDTHTIASTVTTTGGHEPQQDLHPLQGRDRRGAPGRHADTGADGSLRRADPLLGAVGEDAGASRSAPRP